MSKLRELLAKLADTAQTVRSSVADSGLLATLAGEHHEVRTLMGAILDDAAAGKTAESGELRRQVFHKLRAAQLAHAKAEEQVFYRALAQHDTLIAPIELSLHEHDEIEALINQLDHLPADDANWLPTLSQLATAFERHTQKEETAIFGEARRLLSKEQLHDLDVAFARVAERYRELLESRIGEPQSEPRP